MNTIPSFESYGNYSSSNYGAHALVFTDPNHNAFYFSYKTLVAFRHNGCLYVTQNRWGPTTGKHLNWIDGGNKSGRLTQTQFEAQLTKASSEQVSRE